MCALPRMLHVLHALRAACSGPGSHFSCDFRVPPEVFTIVGHCGKPDGIHWHLTIAELTLWAISIELHCATLSVPPDLLKLSSENDTHPPKPSKSKQTPGATSGYPPPPIPGAMWPYPTGFAPFNTAMPQAYASHDAGVNPGAIPILPNLRYVSIERLLEVLDEEELPPKSHLVMKYKEQFASHGFCTIYDLTDTNYLSPKVLSELLEPKPPFMTCVCIIRHAKDEVQHTQDAYLSGDRSVLI
ncbi:uncharacterized protein EI90DRAFT_3011774 [Cantharellus anzutake]|uniref:uncharacterized protein n=1 Tax=Cantharellus anzutake TaxID=1750568 RepID=UPI001903F5C5|nr:uncharacterized protein EI90DRAFT_3011774 [Cantharellus anzutake]KAF8342270.1 hypothetical protein EI90DRAFT_3011774 [Cantharellus anzutake]